MPSEGDGLHCYRLEEEHMTAILHKDNVGKVAKALAVVQTKLAELLPVIDFEKLELLCQDSNTVADDVAQKLKLWKAVACSGCPSQDMLSYMKELRGAWHAAKWESSYNVWTRSIGGCFLQICAKAMKDAATFSQGPDSGIQRVMDAFPALLQGLEGLKLEKQEDEGSSESEKEPSRFQAEKDKLGADEAADKIKLEADLLRFDAIIASLVSTAEKKVLQFQEQAKLVEEEKKGLQFQEQAKLVEQEKHKLEEVSRLQAEKADAAAEQIRPEAELVGFEAERVRFEAERDRFEAERVVFEAERVRFEEERVRFEAERVRFDAEKAELAAN